MTAKSKTSEIKEKRNMKKSLIGIVSVIALVAICAAPVLATGTGGFTPTLPTGGVGYTSDDWSFQLFSGTPALSALTTANLIAADQPVSVVGTYSSLLDVTSKKLAIINIASANIGPGDTSKPFPSIWVKGTTNNTATDSPITYLTSNAGANTEAKQFYQTGLTVQAPYWDVANYQWTVYVYADKDVLSQTTGPATGTVLDPRVSTMRWFAWSDSGAGVPEQQWMYKNADGSLTQFNTMPLTSGGTAAQIKTFLTGTTGASIATNEAQVAGKTKAAIVVADGVCYNIDRNSNVPNGMAITNRSQVGLVYASPADATCHRTENLHLQFMVSWPTAAGGMATGAKSCDIQIYQRTAP